MQDTRITAGMVAAELRKLADAPSEEPEAEIDNPYVYFSSGSGENAKAKLQAMARLLPRPVTKKFGEHDVELIYETRAIRVKAYAPRNLVCTVLEPAKPAVYDCIPLLSPDEEAALEGAA